MGKYIDFVKKHDKIKDEIARLQASNEIDDILRQNIISGINLITDRKQNQETLSETIKAIKRKNK